MHGDERDALAAEAARPVGRELDVGARAWPPGGVHGDGADGEVRGGHDGRAGGVERGGEARPRRRRGARTASETGPASAGSVGAVRDGGVGRRERHGRPVASARKARSEAVSGRVWAAATGIPPGDGPERDGADEGGDGRREGAALDARGGGPAAVGEADGRAGRAARVRRDGARAAALGERRARSASGSGIGG